MTVELIAIPNGLAGCKRKIEFDRCRWERRGGRKDDRGERLVAQVWHGRWLIGIRIPFVRKGKTDVGERRDSHRKEGRKEGGEEKELFGTTGNRINAAKTPGYSTADRARLRAFGDNYRPADSISIGYHAPRASRAVDQSFSSKLKRDLLGVVALVAVIKNVVKPRDPRARGNDLPRK